MTEIDMRVLNPDARLIIYTELNKCFNVSDIFQGRNKVIILYLLQSKTSGHWVTLYKSPKGIVHFFDSYGLPEDAELSLLTASQRAEFGEKQNRLKILLRDTLVIYWNVRIQGPGTDTCGMFVTHRLHHYGMEDPEYLEYLTHLCEQYNMDPDGIVSMYCSTLLKHRGQLK